MQLDENIVISFGPRGSYYLSIPIKDIEETKLTGRAFVEAGIVLMSHADSFSESQTKKDRQKLFTWMTNSDEKAA